jgi:hypothetical protein
MEENDRCLDVGLLLDVGGSSVLEAVFDAFAVFESPHFHSQEGL